MPIKMKKKLTPFFMRRPKRLESWRAPALAGQGYQRPSFRGQDVHDGVHVSTDGRRLSCAVDPGRTLTLEEVRARCAELGLKSR